MDYLFFELGWYIAAAFVLGLVVGWLSCSRKETA
jgi:hypothetical protein